MNKLKQNTKYSIYDNPEKTRSDFEYHRNRVKLKYNNNNNNNNKNNHQI